MGFSIYSCTTDFVYPEKGCPQEFFQGGAKKNKDIYIYIFSLAKCYEYNIVLISMTHL